VAYSTGGAGNKGSTGTPFCTGPRAAVMQFKPAEFNRAVEARRVFRRRALVAEQERRVELLDVDAPILHRLEGAGVIQQTARSFVWIGIWSVGAVSHDAAPQ